MKRRARDVVVVGASAGGFHPLQTLFTDLPADFGAAVAVVLHRSPSFVPELTQVVGHSKLTPIEPEDGRAFEPGFVFIAPRDQHMTVADGNVQLDRGPKQHHARPAIDPLFRSAAESYGDRVIGVLLSGALSDGVSGLLAIKARGGMCVIQDPHEASFPSMPINALRYDHVDLMCPIAVMARALVALVDGESPADLANELSGVLLPSSLTGTRLRNRGRWS